MLTCYIAGVFFLYSAPIHWLVPGHMTSNNETVSRQIFLSTSSRETLRFSGNKIHCSPRDQSLSVTIIMWPGGGGYFRKFRTPVCRELWRCLRMNQIKIAHTLKKTLCSREKEKLATFFGLCDRWKVLKSYVQCTLCKDHTENSMQTRAKVMQNIDGTLIPTADRTKI